MPAALKIKELHPPKEPPSMADLETIADGVAVAVGSEVLRVRFVDSDSSASRLSVDGRTVTVEIDGPDRRVVRWAGRTYRLQRPAPSGIVFDHVCVVWRRDDWDEPARRLDRFIYQVGNNQRRHRRVATQVEEKVVKGSRLPGLHLDSSFK